jgi:flagellum-specific peptidoglycan hydrolase FlgJ
LLLNFDKIRKDNLSLSLSLSSDEFIDFIIKHAQDNEYLEGIKNAILLSQNASMRISLFGDL